MKKKVLTLILTSILTVCGCNKNKNNDSNSLISHYITTNSYEFNDIGLQDYQLERLWTIFDNGVGKYTKGDDFHFYEICQNNDLIIYSKKIYIFSSYFYFEINLIDKNYLEFDYHDKLFSYYERMAECLGYLTSLFEYTYCSESSDDFVSSLSINNYIFNSWTTINNVDERCLNLKSYTSFQNSIDQTIFVGGFLNDEIRYRGFPSFIDNFSSSVSYYSLFRDDDSQIEKEISIEYSSLSDNEVNSLMNYFRESFDEINKDEPLAFTSFNTQEAFIKGSFFIHKGSPIKGKKDIVLKDIYTFSFKSVIQDDVKKYNIHLDITYALKSENESNEYYEIKADGIHTNVGENEIVVPQNLPYYNVTLNNSDN